MLLRFENSQPIVPKGIENEGWVTSVLSYVGSSCPIDTISQPYGLPTVTKCDFLESGAASDN